MTLEYSAFAVDGRPDLTLIVYNPASEADRAAIESAVVPGRASPRPGEA